MIENTDGEIWTGKKVDWEARWRRDEHTLEEKSTNDHLVAFSERMPKDGRVLVPLAGKSNAMTWLRDRGFSVVGIEFVEQAVEEFFEENQIPYDRCEGSHLVYGGAGIEIIVADVFDVMPESVGKVAWIFDRAALVAIRRDERARYVEHLMRFLEPGGKVLVVAIDHDQKDATRPPFALPPLEIVKLFSGHQLDLLDARDVHQRYPRLRARGLRWILEQVWLVTK